MSSSVTYRVKFADKRVFDFYENSDREKVYYVEEAETEWPANEDAGFDLFVTQDVVFKKNQTILVDFYVHGEMIENGENIAYCLKPRSSIYKHDMVMMNSEGVVDKGYRGSVKAPLKWLGNENTLPTETYTLEAGTRVCQITHPNFVSFDTRSVNKLSDSKRGEKGFGSSGK